VPPELKRDPWLEGICAARMHLSLSGIAQASEPLRRIVTAPPMALTFFTRHILHLTLALPYPGSLFPGIDGGPDFQNGLEWSLSRHPWLTCAPRFSVSLIGSCRVQCIPAEPSRTLLPLPLEVKYLAVLLPRSNHCTKNRAREKRPEKAEAPVKEVKRDFN
jgi:hypothetical protein